MWNFKQKGCGVRITPNAINTQLLQCFLAQFIIIIPQEKKYIHFFPFTQKTLFITTLTRWLHRKKHIIYKMNRKIYVVIFLLVVMTTIHSNLMFTTVNFYNEPIQIKSKILKLSIQWISHMCLYCFRQTAHTLYPL